MLKKTKIIKEYSIQHFFIIFAIKKKYYAKIILNYLQKTSILSKYILPKKV